MSRRPYRPEPSDPERLKGIVLTFLECRQEPKETAVAELFRYETGRKVGVEEVERAIVAACVHIRKHGVL